MQQEVSSGFLAHVKMLDELEAMGLLETVEIDPVTGGKRRRITDKGRAVVKIRGPGRQNGK